MHGCIYTCGDRMTPELELPEEPGAKSKFTNYIRSVWHPNVGCGDFEAVQRESEGVARHLASGFASYSTWSRKTITPLNLDFESTSEDRHEDVLYSAIKYYVK